jgi:aminomuconate-semialdehyde/2-hydroxymuconate-6-semialdehyde dehydrogenase
MKVGAESFTFGRPEDNTTTMGLLISKTHRDKVLTYFNKATEQGATVIAGGGIPKDLPDELKDGFWVEPTIWTGLSEDAVVIKEEIFGPCCHIAPFDSEEEVIKLDNNTPYGLASALWTENVSRAHRVAKQLDTGIIWVNSWFLRDLRTAFGGMKQSGIGREGGVHSLEFYTELKNICLKL